MAQFKICISSARGPGSAIFGIIEHEIKPVSQSSFLNKHKIIVFFCFFFFFLFMERSKNTLKVVIKSEAVGRGDFGYI